MNVNNMNITMKNGDSTSLDLKKKYATRKVGFLRQKGDYQKAIKSPKIAVLRSKN